MTKKVLIIAPCFLDTIGGIETHIKSLINAGVSDRVIVYQHGQFFNESDRQPLTLRKLRELAERYDTIWSHHPRILLRMRWLIPRKVYFNSSHGFVFHQNRSFFRQSYMAYKLILARLFGIKVLCVSASDFGFGRYFGAKFLPNFCRFATEPVDENIDAERAGLVCVGRFSPHKRIDKIAQFRRALGDAIPVTVVCPSDDAPKYNELLDANILVDLDDEKLKSVYRRSRFFISLSDFEGFGLAAIEAVALGCVPILSKNDAYQSFRQQGLKALFEEDLDKVVSLHSNPDASLEIARHNQTVIELYQLNGFLKQLRNFRVI